MWREEVGTKSKKKEGTPKSEREEEELEMLHARANRYKHKNGDHPTPENIFLKDCSPWRSHARAEQTHQNEGAVKRNHLAQTVPPHHHLSFPCAGQGEESGMKLSLQRGEKRWVFKVVSSSFPLPKLASTFLFYLAINESSSSLFCLQQ